MFALKVHARTIVLVFAVALMYGSVLALASPEQRLVLMPVATAIAITAALIVALWNRRGAVPLFDLGCIAVVATAFYTIVPPLQYVFAGMRHTILSAFQLWVLQPTTSEVAALAWTYVAYLAGLSTAYFAFSYRFAAQPARPANSGEAIRVLVAAYLVLTALVLCYSLVFGVDPRVAYREEVLMRNYEAMLAMPLVMQQLFSLILTTLFMVKLGLLLAIFLHWRHRFARLLLLLWLLFALGGYLMKMGARSELVLTLFGGLILYHQFVRPLRLGRLAVAGSVLVVGFLALGIVRGLQGVDSGLEDLRLAVDYRQELLSMQNEFQVVFAGAYDLAWLKQHGAVQHVPTQFRFYDPVMLIPQQLLPFTKLDVQQWYLKLSTAPAFFMFNPIAQAVLGFGWVEVLLRGLALGAVFAWVRRWYLRNAHDFWKTLCYTALIVMSYYSVRGTAFYFFAHMALYNFVPILLVARLLRQGRQAVAPRPAAAVRPVFP